MQEGGGGGGRLEKFTRPQGGSLRLIKEKDRIFAKTRQQKRGIRYAGEKSSSRKFAGTLAEKEGGQVRRDQGEDGVLAANESSK